MIDLGTHNRPICVSALVDTGACISILDRKAAQRYFQCHGRPFALERHAREIVSLTGHPLKILGTMEIVLEGVGMCTFYVTEEGKHDAIIGWNLLQKHGFKLDNDRLEWGGKSFLCNSYLLPVNQGSVNCFKMCKKSVTMQHKVDSLLAQYHSVFGEPGALREANVAPMDIHTEGPPVHQRPYRLPLSKLVIADGEIDKMLQLGIIRPSSSPWASPITLVPKKDGSTRFCVDYRKVNAVTIKDRWPLPHVQEIFDHLGGSKYFSTIDMKTGYWQVPVSPDAIEKTAFVCHRGCYEFLRMPFGLSNAPSHYQRVMSKVLGKFIGRFVMVFLDDVIIYSRNCEEHYDHLQQVFNALQEACLTVKESKCAFFQNDVNLLGYIVSESGLKAQPGKTKAIADQPAPTDIRELRRFLGMATFYRQLIPQFAKIAEPLHLLTRKGVRWSWKAEQDQAFNKLKSELCSDRVMAYPDLNQPYLLYTDACDHAIGAILCQRDMSGIERPIQYVSAQLNSSQRNWATIEKEAFAVIYALKKLRPYLLGADVTVFTDHKPLLSFFVGEVKNTKIQRWAILISEFGAKIKYREGPNNIRADMLSRLTTGELAVIDASTEWIFRETTSDPEAPPLADKLNLTSLCRKQKEEFPDEYALGEEKQDGFILFQGLLYSTNRTNKYEPRFPRLLLPSNYQDQVIKRCHEEGGHSSTLKTMLRVQNSYVWKGMKKAIETYCIKCALCVVHNTRPDKLPMGEMPFATSPGQHISADLIGPLVVSDYGNQYVLTVVDHFSGWLEAYPIPKKTNAEVWKAIRNDYFPRHGSPRVLLTDQGTEFKSRDFDEWL